MALEPDNTPLPTPPASTNDRISTCPFCGCESSELQWSNYAYWVVCSHCEAHGPKADPTDFNRATVEGMDKAARATATADWNTRHTKAEPSRQDEIDDLRAALSAINMHLGSAETHDPVIDNITRTALEKSWPTKAVTS